MDIEGCRFLSNCAVCAVLMLNAHLCTAEDWSQWRGPNRDGVSQETGWLDKWPPTNLWSATIGEGFSSMAVVSNRLYTMGWVDSSTDYNVVYCYDAIAGTQVWSFTYNCPSISYNGPRATPTVHQGRVYTYSQHGDLHCLDAETGTSIWHRVIDGGKPNWGLSSSPLIEGNACIVNSGRYGAAVDKYNGTNYWLSPVSSQIAGHAAPIAFDWNGYRVVGFHTAEGFWGVNAENGNWLMYWLNYGFSHYGCATPIKYGNRLFLSNGREGDCSLIQIKSGVMTNVWSAGVRNTLLNQYTTSVLVGDYLYGIHTANGSLRCIDIRNGDIQWTESAAGSDGMGSLIYAEGYLLWLDYRGRLHIAGATPDTGSSDAYDTEGRSSYEVKPNAHTDEWYTDPVLANGRIYCRSRYGSLICLGLRGAPTDVDGDGMADTWEQTRLTNGMASAESDDNDNDGLSNGEEYTLGTDPEDETSKWNVSFIFTNGSYAIVFPAITANGTGYNEDGARYYTIESRSNLLSGSWAPVPGMADIAGANQTVEYHCPISCPREFFNVDIRLE